MHENFIGGFYERNLDIQQRQNFDTFIELPVDSNGELTIPVSDLMDEEVYLLLSNPFTFEVIIQLEITEFYTSALESAGNYVLKPSQTCLIPLAQYDETNDTFLGGGKIIGSHTTIYTPMDTGQKITVLEIPNQHISEYTSFLQIPEDLSPVEMKAGETYIVSSRRIDMDNPLRNPVFSSFPLDLIMDQ